MFDKSSVHFYPLVFAALSGVVAFAAIMLAYPRDEWLEEMVLHGGVIVAVVYATSLYGAIQMRRVRLLKEELQRLVERDRLTDVATRDHFFAQMEARPDAYGISLMIDIDHFKSVNDTMGHLAGDAVIRHVAAILRRTVRDEDIVCRFGGEEFIVFLEDSAPDSGVQMAERLRSEIEAQVAEIDGEDVRVTVSIGGSLKEATDTIIEAIREADAALYRAKAAGRNRVEMHEDLPRAA